MIGNNFKKEVEEWADKIFKEDIEKYEHLLTEKQLNDAAKEKK